MKIIIRCLLLLILPFSAATLGMKDYKNANGLFGQTDFDTPIINPSQFAAKHGLNRAGPYVQELCHTPGLQCVDIPKDSQWVKIFPDFTERNIMMRLNRMNVALMYRNWLVVPTNWKNLTDTEFSPMPLHRQTFHRKLLVIDLKKFAFGAYDTNGDLLRWGPASGGAQFCPLSKKSCRSATGLHTIFKMGGSNCKSRSYPVVTKGGAPMPFCMFYYKGYAIHASSLSGFVNRSRGCIRLFFNDAMWLNQKFAKIGTRVLVKR